MIQSAVESLGDAINPWGYLLLFALCLLEASAFVGLVIPGETAQLLAGVLAQDGRLSLAGVLTCAVSGAIFGDSLGYEVGRHLGPRLRSSRLGRKVGEHRWQRAHDFVHRNGGKAVFFGRWIGVLRSLVPAIAGDARMRYRRFLFWNVLGALISAPAVILLGYLAGSSYHVVEARLGQASYVLVALVAVAVATHRVRRRRRQADRADPQDARTDGRTTDG